ITSTMSVGNDLKLEVASLARLLSASCSTRLSICCCGWRSAWPSCAAARTPSATSRFSPSGTKSPFCVGRSSGRTAACRPDDPGCAGLEIAAWALALLSGHAAPLASGIGAQALVCLWLAPTARSTANLRSAAQPDSALGPREPTLGRSPHPGRTPQARLLGLGHHHPRRPTPSSRSSGTSPRWSDLGAVSRRSRRSDPCLRLLYRRHGAASDPLRVGLHGDRQPPHSLRQLHRPSQRRLGHSA